MPPNASLGQHDPFCMRDTDRRDLDPSLSRVPKNLAVMLHSMFRKTRTNGKLFAARPVSGYMFLRTHHASYSRDFHPRPQRAQTLSCVAEFHDASNIDTVRSALKTPVFIDFPFCMAQGGLQDALSC